MPIEWLQELIRMFCEQFPPETFLHYTFNVRALLAVVLTGLICGSVGALVIGNRMAFFSDALAHTAFAGVALALIAGLMIGYPRGSVYYELGVPAMMVLFGIAIGSAIAYVREKTGLASDTVIGVFFAGSVGLGGVLFGALGQRGYFNLQQFIFGDPLAARESHLIVLGCLAVITFAVLLVMYNYLVLTSFNPSLARSRNVPVRLCDYLFICLLALIVNLCLQIVGALLITAMLIVPAATAGNLARNMRQLFWLTVLISVAVGVAGMWLSFELVLPVGGTPLTLGSVGVIVCLSVLLFFGSMFVRRLRHRWQLPGLTEARS
jgi:zinc transport system permease protein